MGWNMWVVVTPACRLGTEPGRVGYSFSVQLECPIFRGRSKHRCTYLPRVWGTAALTCNLTLNIKIKAIGAVVSQNWFLFASLATRLPWQLPGAYTSKQVGLSRGHQGEVPACPTTPRTPPVVWPVQACQSLPGQRRLLEWWRLRGWSKLVPAASGRPATAPRPSPGDRLEQPRRWAQGGPGPRVLVPCSKLPLHALLCPPYAPLASSPHGSPCWDGVIYEF